MSWPFEAEASEATAFNAEAFRNRVGSGFSQFLPCIAFEHFKFCLVRATFGLERQSDLPVGKDDFNRFLSPKLMFAIRSPFAPRMVNA